ncbi:MAG: preprotein translocase subunit SecE [Nevskiales bacterium]|nr:preprotein translocase subunit SecE [Nevskiales bacterium]
MTSQPPTELRPAAPLDTVFLVLSLVALGGGIAAFYSLADTLGTPVRTLLVLGGLGLSLGLAYQAPLGKTMWGYIRGSNIELRKTTWPTRQESLQATLMIAVVVLLTALMLWGLDAALLWGVKALTGRG